MYFQSVVIRSNSSTTTSNSRSQNRRSRHLSYTDGISGQSENRVFSTAAQLEASSAEKSSSSAEFKDTVCVREVEQVACIPRAEEEIPMINTEVEVNVHENGVQMNQREEIVHIHVDAGICNENCDPGIPGYLEAEDNIDFESMCNNSDLPLLPKFHHSDETLETDDDFLTESSESCYLHRAEANV